MPVASAVMSAPDTPGRRPSGAAARGGSRPATVAHGGAGIRLGDAIAGRRRELGLSRRQLAERAALSYPFVAELERGSKSPSTASLSSLATALELTVAQLVGAAEVPGAADRCESGHSRRHPGGHDAPVVPAPPSTPERPVPSLRASDEAGADLGRFVRDIVRDELAAAEDRRHEAAGGEDAGGGNGGTARRPRSALERGLAGEVLDTVRHLLGDDTVAVDDQGDIPVPRDGTMLFVRLLDGPSSVLVFCPVLVDLPPTLPLLERLNELNEGVRFVRFCSTENGVVVDLEMFGEFFEPPMLPLAIRAVAGAAARFGPELREVFGGRLFLDAERAADERRDTAGYL
jgi:transcriptional regulator with XRE-family HTH domain